MKILQLPTYVTIKQLPKFFRRKSGYGYMTWDISRSLAEIEGTEVDVLTKFNFNSGEKYSGVNLLKLRWYDILFNINFLTILKGLHVIFSEKLNLRKSFYIFYYYLSSGYLEKIIRNNNYDIIHIHGVGYFNQPIMEICNKYNLRFVTTLHGLNSFSPQKKISFSEAKVERNFLEDAERSSFNVTVVSSGVKNTIINYLQIQCSSNFKVILNGCEMEDYSTNHIIDIRNIYNIKPYQKIMLCVGRIDSNKNQTQIIRSLQYLEDDVKSNLVFLFVGADGTAGQILNQIDSDISSNLKYCGYVEKEDLLQYYNQSDFNIIVSIKEGFGLPIIEGYKYGLPCLTFSDLDAVEDLYDEGAMIKVLDRTDKSLANGISKMFKNNWDKDFIKRFSYQFSLQIMAHNYKNYFDEILNIDKKEVK